MSLFVVTLCFLLLGFVPEFIAVPFQVCVFLVIGWIISGWRMLQGIEIAQALWWWMGGCVLLAMCVHGFLVSWRSAIGSQWRLRSTVAAGGILWMALFAGMCLAGSVHQMGWLFGSKERWVGSSLRQSRRATEPDMFLLAEHVARTLKDAEGKDYWLEGWHSERGLDLTYVLQVRTDDEGAFRAVYVWPRKTSEFRTLGGCVVRATGEVAAEPYERFQKLVEAE